jgi:hypothetical protein
MLRGRPSRRRKSQEPIPQNGVAANKESNTSHNPPTWLAKPLRIESENTIHLKMRHFSSVSLTEDVLVDAGSWRRSATRRRSFLVRPGVFLSYAQ